MIRKNDIILIKPEFQDKGDDKYTWIALEDENGGRVLIAPANSGLALMPNQVVKTSMVQRLEAK